MKGSVRGLAQIALLSVAPQLSLWASNRSRGAYARDLMLIAAAAFVIAAAAWLLARATDRALVIVSAALFGFFAWGPLHPDLRRYDARVNIESLRVETAREIAAQTT